MKRHTAEATCQTVHLCLVQHFTQSGGLRKGKNSETPLVSGATVNRVEYDRRLCAARESRGEVPGENCQEVFAVEVIQMSHFAKDFNQTTVSRAH
jgi:hypothetical protein